MKRPEPTDARTLRLLKNCILFIAFLAITVAGFYLLRMDSGLSGSVAQQAVYTLGTALLLALLGTLWLREMAGLSRSTPHGRWFYPLLAAALGGFAMLMVYMYLGIWPIGKKSVMLIDMHHQYAPLLAELRDMLREGGSVEYSFHIGLGTNFIPAFAYYMASPLNILLLLFPERLLTEAILLITLIKIAFAAGAFAACAQFITRRRDVTTLPAAVMYALMMYMLAYSWNIMWLDGVMMLPLVVLALERLLRTGKPLLYIFTLAYSLFASYYIGFMMCMFLVLYFAVWLLRSRRTAAERLRGSGRFALCSLLGGGLTGALLIPTALALRLTSAAGGEFPEFASNFNLFRLFGQLFWGTDPTIRSGNLPNLYCGLAAVLLVPAYLTCREIPLRRRLSGGGLLAVMALSCTINQWDLLWHGLHVPNDLPYRFSFLLCFTAMLMAARVLPLLNRVTPRQIFAGLGGAATYLILWQQLDSEAVSDETIYVSLLLLTVYAAILLLTAQRKMRVRAGVLLLLAVVSGEMILNGTRTVSVINRTEYYTEHSNYVDNDGTAATRLALEKAQLLGDAAANGSFYRMEFLPRATCMDTALYHYNGITTFASSNPYSATCFMGNLGYAINGVNSYLYNTFCAAPDSLLGVRYVVLESLINNHPQLKLLDSVTVGEETRYIYENTLALPLGYFVRSKVADYSTASNDPFTSQDNLLNTMTGEIGSVYTALPLTAQSGSGTVGTSSFTVMGGQDVSGATFSATVDQQGQYFAYVECQAADSLSVSTVDETGTITNTWTVTSYEPYIIDMGTLSQGYTAEVSVSADTAVSGNIYIVRLDSEALNTRIAALASGGLRITDWSATTVNGTVTAPEDGLMFFSIPYDSGWSATVDGAPVAAQAVCSNASGENAAMLAIPVTSGTHTVTLHYTTPGLLAGLLASLLSAAGILLLGLLSARARRRRAAKAAPVLPEVPAPVPEEYLPVNTQEYAPEASASEMLPTAADIPPLDESVTTEDLIGELLHQTEQPDDPSASKQ